MVLAGVFLSTAGNAQESGLENIKYGVKGGLTIGKLSTNFDEVVEQYFPVGVAETYTENSAVGFAVGGYVETQIAPNLSAELDTFIVQKNGKVEVEVPDYNFKYESDIKLTYLEIAPTIKYSVSNFYVLGGPFLAYILSAKYDETVTVSGVSTSDSGDIEDISSLDYGLTFGVGMTYGKFLAEIRFDLGLKDIDDATTDNVEEEVKTRALYMMAGYTF
ncbi:porin family protein [Desulfurobacterium atlanticum]|uniref:Outer membrane protein beta-barrel domain-containing protein n=1 Tax=Desulfurobacterium atlanticum TaxID=240169 RepID=A0A238ZK50_9BACT|nr:porin family protein [Desulfurobacterium atlanticum]SNR83836.1 Outer membrane protein beta-barrel domain-containing protein [Desulfurobacterium atlanticum]